MDWLRGPRVSSEKWLSALCSVGLAGAGAAAWLSGQQGAGYVFFALIGLLLVGLAYQAYRRRTAPHGGPPDPSAQWSRDARAAHRQQATTFRYSKTTLVVLRWLWPLSALAGPAIYFLSTPRPTGGDLAGLGAFEAVVVLAFYGGYRACATYLIEITPDVIRVNGLYRRKELLFSSLGKVALLEGGGRGPRYVLALYDKQGKQLCTLNDGVEHFEDMVALAKEYAFAAGTPYRYRDMWGVWTA